MSFILAGPDRFTFPLEQSSSQPDQFLFNTGNVLDERQIDTPDIRAEALAREAMRVGVEEGENSVVQQFTLEWRYRTHHGGRQ